MEPLIIGSAIKTIVELAKELESRAKDRQGMEALQKIYSIAFDLQSKQLQLMEENDSLRGQLAELQKPKFSDECEFLPKYGVYRHASRPGYFCGSCTPNQVISPLRNCDHGWECQINGCEKFHSDPDRPPRSGVISI